MLHFSKAHLFVAKIRKKQNNSSRSRLQINEGEFGVMLLGSFAWVNGGYFPYMCDGPWTSRSFLLGCPCWLLTSLLLLQSACTDCMSVKCQVRCRWYEWPGHRSEELHTRQLLPTHSIQYVLSKPITCSNMWQCRTAAVRRTKHRMCNCAQQQSSLQQCLQLPVPFTAAAGHVCHTAAPQHVCKRREGSYNWVACVTWLHVSCPLFYVHHVMMSALT